MLGQLLDRRYQVVEVLGGQSNIHCPRYPHRPGSPISSSISSSSSDPRVLETARRLFKSEAETLEQLGYHDQIPRLLAYFEENQFYLVQEFRSIPSAQN